MADPYILMAPKDTISPEDKSTLRDAGVIVVEVADPGSVRLLHAGYEVPHGEILKAAAKAISQHSVKTNNVRELFGDAVAQAILAQGGGNDG